MTEEKKKEEKKKTLSLGKGTLSLKGGSTAPAQPGVGSGGRGGKSVAVEVRRRRVTPSSQTPTGKNPVDDKNNDDGLTSEEKETRVRALQKALEEQELKKEEAARRRAEEAERAKQEQTEQKKQGKPLDKDELRRRELEELKEIEEEERKQQEETERLRLELEQERQREEDDRRKRSEVVKNVRGHHQPPQDNEKDDKTSYRERMKKNNASPRRGESGRRRSGKLTVAQALNEDYAKERQKSLAAQRRAREKARMNALNPAEPPKKIVHDVVVPETITVQELANRMAEKGADVIKSLMQMGVMATINQAIDADTAELIVEEFGHKIKRVTEADIETGIEGEEDTNTDMIPRPPVVTVMGHVDHGKTSLLDALRATDVVSGEAGGITQHIGAYQVQLSGGDKITFLDTPGHAAFTEMRARGANVTDLVILVVAANDSIMPQTIEAINHAKAADVPLIIAINKIDLPDANPNKVKQDLLQHEVVIEDMGGDVLCLEVSAKKKINLDKLEETILLQAEVLELRANPNRTAQGTVVEAKLEQGRGSVATVLIQKGTLKIGDIFVVGAEWGKVRALINDRGQNIDTAIPGQPVEVLGLNGTPDAGDQFIVVSDEARAREISSYRQRKKREAASAIKAGHSSLEQLMARAKEGEKKKLPVLIKGDVHGSVEALVGSLEKLTEENKELEVQILHTGVGGITESDVTLAKASGALIIGFNVRANAQARDLAQRDGIDMRYYNVIYNAIDDAKAILGGMLSPTIREEYLGQAEIRQVFRITKVGNIAGCMVTTGNVKRGANVRLLRDNVVIHEGSLKTLKRFQDEVKEVKEGMECGMAFENYDDIKEGDIIECFEVVEEARSFE